MGRPGPAYCSSVGTCILGNIPRFVYVDLIGKTIRVILEFYITSPPGYNAILILGLYIQADLHVPVKYKFLNVCPFDCRSHDS